MTRASDPRAPRDHPRRRRPGAAPAPPRPPHPGDAARAACLLMTLLWWMFDDSRWRSSTGRAGAAGAVPVHHHVPGDQGDDAARALQRHARATARDADGQARLPRRLRAGVRPGRRGAVGAGGRADVGLLGLDVRARSGCSPWSPSPTPCSARALGLFVSAFAQTEFQAVQFMPAVVIPQILLCGLFVAARRAAAVPRGGQRRAPAVVRRRRDADAHGTPDDRRRLARRLAVVLLRAAPAWPSALPLLSAGARA